MKSSDITIGQHIIYLQKDPRRTYRAITRIPGEIIGTSPKWVKIRILINDQPVIRTVKAQNIEVEEGAGQ